MATRFNSKLYVLNQFKVLAGKYFPQDYLRVNSSKKGFRLSDSTQQLIEKSKTIVSQLEKTNEALPQSTRPLGPLPSHTSLPPHPRAKATALHLDVPASEAVLAPHRQAQTKMAPRNDAWQLSATRHAAPAHTRARAPSSLPPHPPAVSSSSSSPPARH